MKVPLISILIPVVRVEFFNHAFSSALGQDFDDFEIVVVDNKADGDVSWVSVNEKVRYIKNENRLPPVTNWNHGLSKCRGDYVILLSDDDVLESFCLSSVAELIMADARVGIIRLKRANIDSRGVVTGYSAPGAAWESVGEYVYNQYTFNRGQVLSDIVFDRKRAIQLGGFPEVPIGWGADHLFAITMAASAGGVFNINKCCMRYRIHQLNLSNSIGFEGCLNRLNADRLWIGQAHKMLELAGDDYAKYAIECLRGHAQRQQDYHYSCVFASGGLYGIYKLNSNNAQPLGSRFRSILKAIGYKVSILFGLALQSR